MTIDKKGKKKNLSHFSSSTPYVAQLKLNPTTIHYSVSSREGSGSICYYLEAGAADELDPVPAPEGRDLRRVVVAGEAAPASGRRGSDGGVGGEQKPRRRRRRRRHGFSGGCSFTELIAIASSAAEISWRLEKLSYPSILESTARSDRV